ncbi:MAG: Rid family hydrolase [Mangrovibacterium sp.]
MKKIISTPRVPAAIGPYSQAVEVNGTLFVSGQIPFYPASGKLVEGGVAGQTEQVMKNIGAILEAAGYRFPESDITEGMN